MNRVNELIELCGKRYVKKFAITFAVMLLYTLFQSFGYWNLPVFGVEITTANILSLNFVYVFIIVIVWMHHRRFKKVMQEGSLNRIRLLPIPKMSIVYSEMLYVGATYAIMMLVIGLGFISGFLVAGGRSVNEFFYFLANNTALSVYLPMSFLDVLKAILMLVMLTYGTVLFLLTNVDSDLHTTTKVILIIFLIVCWMLNKLISVEGFNGNPSLSYVQITCFKMVEMVLVSAFAHYRLFKFFGRKEKKS